jgi:NAD(P)-dependent dehydrogenase (short-subunit alcohol dehydrogenase family)
VLWSLLVGLAPASGISPWLWLSYSSTLASLTRRGESTASDIAAVQSRDGNIAAGHDLEAVEARVAAEARDHPPAMRRELALGFELAGALDFERPKPRTHVAYSTTKLGLLAFSKSTAISYAKKGIRCNTDIAHAVLFLVSDEARYITAAEILVDGGLTATSRLG